MSDNTDGQCHDFQFVGFSDVNQEGKAAASGEAVASGEVTSVS